MRRQHALAAAVIVSAQSLLLTNVAVGEIALEVSPGVDLGVGGLHQYRVSAIATEEEPIAGIWKLHVAGKPHQVFGVGRDQTPAVDYHPLRIVHPDWVDFDTHVTLVSNQTLAIVGEPLSEANDFTTIAALGLPEFLSQLAPSGFGELSQLPNGAIFLLPSARATPVEFLQVVAVPGTARLAVNIFTGNGPGDFDAVEFENVRIGVPEPATGLLSCWAIVCLVATRRRR